MRSHGRLEAVLVDFGGGAGDLDWWRLEGEELRLSDFARVRVLNFIAFAVLGGGLRVVVLGVTWWWFPAARARGERTEARRVGCRLGAELGEVEIGASLVADGHGLSELALGPETVEDDCVDDDAEGFDDDFDDAADERPVLRVAVSGEAVERCRVAHLKTAHETIGYVVLEQVSSWVFHARPSPHVFAVSL